MVSDMVTWIRRRLMECEAYTWFIVIGFFAGGFIGWCVAAPYNVEKMYGHKEPKK
jgi:hypothetical protein